MKGVLRFVPAGPAPQEMELPSAGMGVFSRCDTIRRMLLDHPQVKWRPTALEVPELFPGLLLTVQRQFVDLLQQSYSDYTVQLLELPQAAFGRVYAYDFATFNGRGALVYRCGLVIRRQGYASVTAMEDAEKQANYPSIGYSIGDHTLRLRKGGLIPETAALARRCFNERRRYFEIGNNLLLRVPYAQN